MLKNVKIRLKITILLVIVLIVSVIVHIEWSKYSQIEQAEWEILQTARIIDQEMEAVWDFIEINQQYIDTDVDEYDFNDYYCALGGKAVAELFMKNNDFDVRFVSSSPRYSGAYPDEFEKTALAQFKGLKESDEYYELAIYEGRDVFRYASPLYIKESCLSCHGGTKGELDVTGHPKEGLKIGDVAGAISIIMPIDPYLRNIESNISRESLFFLAVSIATIAVVYFAISRLVMRPLQKMEKAVECMTLGDLDVDFTDTRSSGEILELQRKFKLMATQLKILYDSLEDEVEDRTRQLVEANRILDEQRVSLKQANEMLQTESQYKSDFLATMSHELRTPLTSILAFTDIWARSNANLSAKDLDAIREVQENGKLLLNMVNNILEAARIEAGKMELNYETVDMVDLISTVEGIIQPLAERRGILFTTSVDPSVPLIHADWEKLRSIVENLASNAIKFTQQGGTISIAVTCDPDREGWIAISVSDTGVGINEEDIPRVFERFSQLDKSVHRNYGGSGIGLAVVKDLTEAHHGVVEVTSTPKTGSTFTVRIPVDNPERQVSK